MRNIADVARALNRSIFRNSEVGLGVSVGNGGCCRDRTYDKLIKSQLLYQLS